jgi:undecaprenyl-diphosphatase
MIESIPQWDKDVFFVINGWRTSFFDGVMPMVSYPWLLWAMGLGAFGIWGIIAYRKSGTLKSLKPVLFGMVFMLGTVGVNDLLANMAKDHVGRLRPSQSLSGTYYNKNGEWRVLNPGYTPRRQKADSFFSGHASHSMAVAVNAATLCPPLSPVIFAMPVVVGYSRIYLGKHYPSDIICGWFAGAAVALLARQLTRRTRENLGLPMGKNYPKGKTAKWFSVCRAKKTAGSE